MPDCTHPEIRPKATKLDNGQWSHQWFCQGCGTEFVPYLVASIAEGRREQMERRVVSAFHIIDRLERGGYVTSREELQTWLATAKEVIDVE